jgi:hypothetical protein
MRRDLSFPRLSMVFTCLGLLCAAAPADARREKPVVSKTIPSFFWGEWSEDGLEKCAAKDDNTRIILGPRRFFIQGEEVPVGKIERWGKHAFVVHGSKLYFPTAEFAVNPKDGAVFRDSEVFLTRCPKVLDSSSKVGG